MGNMGKLLKQAQKMQGDMAKVQEEINQLEVEKSAGGDMVIARVNGANEILSIKINPEVVDPEDIETLEDLVIVAVNSALQEAKNQSDARMAKVTGGLGGMMGGAPGMPF
ncbi:YbaB/EbfC family nucleoid-associated protein [bacterium]|nr:YbaB/EbfC family nucleoid-associated protein [bacterium]